ncbi:hypothetical protein GE300_06040 [Rhodobacteraceae bacterium 2CG4]|uniref:Uncharacterized protein n=1 Tax=Halovulum marinum TaxID=2662447 RepID=A0A6L5YZ95_9RHOB|nr:hypothetical protein [Halovulum marinum]MSU89182.1 hypothetical protein [Halovulum marinum]
MNRAAAARLPLARADTGRRRGPGGGICPEQGRDPRNVGLARLHLVANARFLRDAGFRLPVAAVPHGIVSLTATHHGPIRSVPNNFATIRADGLRT